MYQYESKSFAQTILVGNRGSAFISFFDQPMFVVTANSTGGIQLYSHRTEYPVLIHTAKDEGTALQLVSQFAYDYADALKKGCTITFNFCSAEDKLSESDSD